MFVQVTIQILVLLLNRTDTPITGGLETIFDEGKSYDATTVLVLSILWSLFSSIKMHTNFTILEKGFCPTTSKLVVLVWATFATLRRILSLITLFIPSMGLFSILHHWRWEKVQYSKFFTDRLDFKVSLFGLNETVYWSQLDRWDYSDPQYPSPPPYTLFTLLTLQHTFIALIVLSTLQFIAIFALKIWISKDFREEYHWTNKGIHVLENLNFASPFRDWDDGDYSIQEFKERSNSVKKEMFGTQAINFLATIIMLLPLWLTGNPLGNFFSHQDN